MLRSMNPTNPPSLEIPGAGVSEIFDVETAKPEVGVEDDQPEDEQSRRPAGACKISGRSLSTFLRYRNFSARFPNPPDTMSYSTIVELRCALRMNSLTDNMMFHIYCNTRRVRSRVTSSRRLPVRISGQNAPIRVEIRR